VRVIASLLPRDVNLTTRNLDDLLDDQLMRKLAMLTEMARPLLADGRPRYSSRGQLYRSRLDGPGGEVLVEATTIPVGPSCRVLMGMGITGPFETWREGVTYACLRGDIGKASGLTVVERDRGAAAFERWQPLQHALSASVGAPSERADGFTGGGGPADANASLRPAPGLIPPAE
jgi:hypothetical protein